VHKLDRSGCHFVGEEPGPAHPFVEALRDAAERGGAPGADAGDDYPDVPRSGRDRARVAREARAAGPGDFAWSLQVARNTPYDRRGRLPDLEIPHDDGTSAGFWMCASTGRRSPRHRVFFP
jgi:hypothetical protein